MRIATYENLEISLAREHTVQKADPPLTACCSASDQLVYRRRVLSAATHGRVGKICLRSIVTLEVEHLQKLPSVLQSSSALTTRAKVQTRTNVQV